MISDGSLKVGGHLEDYRTWRSGGRIEDPGAAEPGTVAVDATGSTWVASEHETGTRWRAATVSADGTAETSSWSAPATASELGALTALEPVRHAER